MPEHYRTVGNDDWFFCKDKGNHVACCDCGLVHEVNFKIPFLGKGHLHANFRRLDDETAAHRARPRERTLRITEDFMETLSEFTDKPVYVRLREDGPEALTLDLREEKP